MDNLDKLITEMKEICPWVCCGKCKYELTCKTLFDYEMSSKMPLEKARKLALGGK